MGGFPLKVLFLEPQGEHLEEISFSSSIWLEQGYIYPTGAHQIVNSSRNRGDLGRMKR